MRAVFTYADNPVPTRRDVTIHRNVTHTAIVVSADLLRKLVRKHLYYAKGVDIPANAHFYVPGTEHAPGGMEVEFVE